MLVVAEKRGFGAAESQAESVSLEISEQLGPEILLALRLYTDMCRVLFPMSASMSGLEALRQTCVDRASNLQFGESRLPKKAIFGCTRQIMPALEEPGPNLEAVRDRLVQAAADWYSSSDDASQLLSVIQAGYAVEGRGLPDPLSSIGLASNVLGGSSISSAPQQIEPGESQPKTFVRMGAVNPRVSSSASFGHIGTRGDAGAAGTWHTGAVQGSTGSSTATATEQTVEPGVDRQASIDTLPRGS